MWNRLTAKSTEDVILPSYTFQFHNGAGPSWQRTLTLPSDAGAKAEGRLLLINQALFRTSEGSVLLVQREEPRSTLGRWTWTGAQPVWSEEA